MSEELELSEREIDIIRLVATGASNKEIAKELFISPNTVKVHLRNIFGKLNVVSRTEATMVAISKGWVESPKTDNSPYSTPTDFENSLNSLGEIPVKKNPFFQIGLPILSIVIIFALGLYAFTSINNQRIASQITPTLPNTLLTNQRWNSLASLPESLNDMAVIRYEQSLYLIGGSTLSGTSNAVYIYEVNSDTWKKGSQKPTAVSQVQAASLGERIYVPGGKNANSNILAAVEVYDPREDRWDQHSDLPSPLSRYALIAFEGRLYLFGGWNGKEFVSDILSYDPEMDVWTKFSQLPQPLADSAVVVVSGVIHIVGGINAQSAQDKHYLFFPQRLLEGKTAWEDANPLPHARYGMGISVLADMVYIAGGSDDQSSILPVIQYLPLSDEWVEIDQPLSAIGLYPAVLPYETRLYVMGGEVGNELQDNNQVYQAVYTILVPVIR